jgi:isoleucyl-tRNA synthetase
MLDFKKTEADILNFWKKKKIYEKVKKRNSKGKPFYFLQGPPYTSGKIHIAHAWNNSLKDIAMRYKRMQGFDVWDRGGYDMHGLPTEHAVQKKLNLKSKEEIEKYGMDKFIKECMKFSIEHAGYMNEDFRKLGIWMDHENAYKPIEKEFISGEWAFFKEAAKQGRLYKGKKVMHWDAEAETSIAKHELEYKTVKDKSIFLKFKKKRTKNEYFLIWTTTPWTIPLNLAIMANPEVDYVKIKVEEEYWIMAKALVSAFMTSVLGKKFKIVEEFKGKQLEGQEYEHFLSKDMGNIYSKLKKESPKIHTIVLSKEYVDTSSGTGLVHCAPGCGPEDNEVGKKNKIEAFNTLDEQGVFKDSGAFTGWVAKKDDGKFIKNFEDKGVLLATTEVEHEYPFSDRTKQPVVFRTTEQWFLKIEDLIPQMLKMNKKVYWSPKKTGTSYEKWTENLRDNGVTRQRFWGCPVPIWINTKDEEDYIVIGSVEELEKLTKKKFTDETIHRPWIDNVEITKNGKTYKRLADVSDVWIDSGTASWNSLYNDPKLIKRYFPADLILEATEQTRLWFSLLQICSAIMFERSCYKNVYVHGMIFDYQGMKMSKSLGNIISPYEVMDKYSADILRYYMCQTTAGEPISFSWSDIKVKQRNLIMLSNIANYIQDLERQKPRKGPIGQEEKWILSKYNSSLKKITELFEAYKIDETIGEIESLFIVLSRDYIKFVREKGSKNSSVLETVKEIYLNILKVFSTICPFITEHLWQSLKQKEESVHLSKWPKFDLKKIDKKLENQFELAMRSIESGLAVRDKEKIGLRWPLAKATITTSAKFSKDVQNIIATQLNVKKIDIKSSKNNEMKVVLDTKMTKELEAEGFARELARKVQSERKKAGLQKKDVISLEVSATPELRKILESQMLFLKDRTNSKTIVIVDKIENKNQIFSTIKGKKFGISYKLEKI